MLQRVSRIFRRYLGNDQGIAAIVFALMIPVLLASAGVAVDIATIYNAKNRLSNALDKAVLAAGSSTTLSTQDLQTRFTNFFNANYPSGEYFGKPSNVQITVNGNTLTATASASVPTTFMAFFGIKSLTINETSQAILSLAGVEAVLVLDVTGSMAGNNIAALKTASTNFLNIMFSKITNKQYLKIGIVPWNEAVNVGSYGWGKNPDGSNYGTAFVSPPSTDDYISPASSITYDTSQTYQWWGCAVEPTPGNVTQDSFPSNWKMYRYPSGSCTGYNCTAYNCVAYSTTCPSGYTLSGTHCCPNAESQYESGSSCCVSGDILSSGHCCPSGYSWSNASSKCKKGASSVAAGTVGTTTGSSQTCTTPGTAQNGATCATYGTTCVQWQNTPNYNCPTSPIIPLTSDQTTLQNEINNLPTLGNTYPDVGMVWGWRVISHAAPFTEGQPSSNTQWSKTVIMMTDGNATVNTVLSGEGAYGVSGTSTSPTDINNKFEDICTAMKAQGIRIYTITFQSAIQASTKQYYSQCATAPNMYYDAPTNQSLIDAFNSIATQLSQLHLSE